MAQSTVELDLFASALVREKGPAVALDHILELTGNFRQSGGGRWEDALALLAPRSTSPQSGLVGAAHSVADWSSPFGDMRRRTPPGGWPERSEDRGFGRNVSSVEVDDLDREALLYGLSLKPSVKSPKVAIDLGCGDGITGVRFALMGIESYLYDLAFPLSLHVTSEYKLAKVKKLNIDLATLSRNHLPRNVDIFYSQRALHYLTYSELLSLLRKVRRCCNRTTRAFLSVAGYDTEIALSHDRRDLPVEQRHGLPAWQMQKKHSIRHPLTIYKPEEFSNALESTGFKTIQCTVSAFGNIKGVFGVAQD